MPAFDVLFFGEVHNDSIGHCVENTLYQLLVQKYGKVALSMEAFDSENQPVLNDYLAGFIPEYQFKTETHVFDPFYLGYRQLLISAKNNKLPVIAANAPNRYIELVATRGMKVLDSLDAMSKALLPPLPYNVEKDKYYEEYKNSIIQAHSMYFSDSVWQSFALYNAAMANSIYQFWTGRKNFKIMSINGTFHSDEKMGIITDLRLLDSSIKIVNISCFPFISFTRPGWKSFIPLADFIIITDAVVKRTF